MRTAVITCITIISLCVAVNSNAQTYLDHLQQKEAGKGTVTVTESKEIDHLVNGKPATTPVAPTTTTPSTTHTSNSNKNTVTTPTAKTPTTANTEEKETSEAESVDMSKKIMTNSYKINGYRVQVYAGGNTRADRQKAEKAGNAVKVKYPNTPVYVHFYSPRWICRIGNYRSMEEASEMLQKVRALGYSQACIVKGKISVQY